MARRAQPDRYPQSKAEIAAVVTVYAPDDQFRERISTISKQTGSVIVIDDGHSRENKHKLRLWFRGNPKVVLQSNEKNIGLAASLNRGVDIARKRGFRWILTMDSDTVLFEDMVQYLVLGLRAVTTQDKKKGAVGLIGMSWLRLGVPGQISLTAHNMGWHDKRAIITSGSLFSVEAYGLVGPFREEFFIDAIDYDYCLRARTKGLRVVQLNRIGFIQPLGTAVQRRVAGTVVHTYEHNPGRLYYQFRNTTVLFRERWSKEPLYAFGALLWFCKTAWRILLYEKDRKVKLLCCVKGLKDGVARRLGKTVPV